MFCENPLHGKLVSGRFTSRNFRISAKRFATMGGYIVGGGAPSQPRHSAPYRPR